MKRTLATRRARVARINAKRPRIVVEIDYAVQSGQRVRFVDLMIALLDARRQSKAR